MKMLLVACLFVLRERERQKVILMIDKKVAIGPVISMERGSDQAMKYQ